MPITKRSKKSPAKATYDSYRKSRWQSQGGAEPWNFRGSCAADGSPLRKSVIQPKPNGNFKDIWHCPNAALARNVAATILGFEEVYYVEFKGVHVFVKWHEQEPWVLDGQESDDRTTVTG